MKKAWILVTIMIIAAMLLGGCAGQGASKKAAKAEKDMVFATVVKSIAFNWFKRMETGVTQFGKDKGIGKSFMEGPPQVDSAAQVAMIEDLIAQNVDAICNVPYGVPENEPAQKKARDAGIVVIGHEAATAKEGTLDYDVEAFDNCSYGEEMVKQLASRMNSTGKYIQFVGSLTNASHNEWMDCAKKYADKNFPNMTFIAKYESKEDQNVAYNTMKDVLKTYPDVAGVMGAAATDVVGAGQAIEEAGLQDKTAVVGTSIPSYAGELLKTGAVDLAMAWDPATAGYACNVIALKVLKGEKITDGMDLGVPGYEKIKLVKGVNGVPVIYGSAWLEMDKNNAGDYNF